MALTADREVFTMFPNVGYIAPIRSNVADVLYKNAFLNVNASGKAVVASDTAGTRPLGLNVKQVTVLAAGSELEVMKATVIQHDVTGATEASVGMHVYATGDDALNVAASNVAPFGVIVGYDNDINPHFWVLLLDGEAGDSILGALKLRTGVVAALTGSSLNVDTGLTTLSGAWAVPKIAAQAAGDPGYCTVDFGADGLLDIYAWDDGGAAATNASPVVWFAVGV